MKRMFESIEESLIDQGNPAPSMQEIAEEYERTKEIERREAYREKCLKAYAEFKGKRFELEPANCGGFWVIDNSIECDGETPSNVEGFQKLEEASAHARLLNSQASEYKCQCGSCYPALKDPADGLLVSVLGVSDEHLEKEGCPDCMKRCERCGELVGSGRSNWIEHCL